MQVAWSLEDEATRARELRALEHAMDELQLRTALLVTADESETVKLAAGTVHVVPAWAWLLEESSATIAG